jgi:hypothetical protein
MLFASMNGRIESSKMQQFVEWRVDNQDIKLNLDGRKGHFSVRVS